MPKRKKKINKLSRRDFIRTGVLSSGAAERVPDPGRARDVVSAVRLGSAHDRGRPGPPGARRPRPRPDLVDKANGRSRHGRGPPRGRGGHQ